MIVENWLLTALLESSAFITQSQGSPREKFNLRSSKDHIQTHGESSALTVTSKMQHRLRVLQQALENLNSNATMLEVTDGYLKEAQDIVEKLKVLAIKATNGTAATQDRQKLQVTVSSLITELDRVATESSYGEIRLFLGDLALTSKTSSMWFSFGSDSSRKLRICIGTMTSAALRLSENGAKISISTISGASDAIGLIDSAIDRIGKQRADIVGYGETVRFATEGMQRESEALKRGIARGKSPQKHIQKKTKKPSRQK